MRYVFVIFLLLSLFLAGCSTRYAFENGTCVREHAKEYDENLFQYSSLRDCEKDNVVINQFWTDVRSDLTNNFDISEEYFDAHFEYRETRTDGHIFGEYDSSIGRKVVLNSIRAVEYVLILLDKEDNSYELKGYFRVMDGALHSDLHPKKELQILITKDEANEIRKKTNGCAQLDSFGKNSLVLLQGEIYWLSAISTSNFYAICKINAETGEVSYFNR